VFWVISVYFNIRNTLPEVWHIPPGTPCIYCVVPIRLEILCKAMCNFIPTYVPHYLYRFFLHRSADSGLRFTQLGGLSIHHLKATFPREYCITDNADSVCTRNALTGVVCICKHCTKYAKHNSRIPVMCSSCPVLVRHDRQCSTSGGNVTNNFCVLAYLSNPSDAYLYAPCINIFL
jgi:hypothetical protein